VVGRLAGNDSDFNYLKKPAERGEDELTERPKEEEEERESSAEVYTTVAAWRPADRITIRNN
jgi:hypothetical protein